MNIDMLTEFLGWCTVINFAILIIGTIFLTLMRDWVIDVHSRLIGVEETELPAIYMKYLAYFKIGTIIFNFTPYIALKIIS